MRPWNDGAWLPLQLGSSRRFAVTSVDIVYLTHTKRPGTTSPRTLALTSQEGVMAGNNNENSKTGERSIGRQKNACCVTLLATWTKCGFFNAAASAGKLLTTQSAP
jgi:hypothetical protein